MVEALQLAVRLFSIAAGLLFNGLMSRPTKRKGGSLYASDSTPPTQSCRLHRTRSALGSRCKQPPLGFAGRCAACSGSIETKLAARPEIFTESLFASRDLRHLDKIMFSRKSH